jgi:PhzF family phenazine biosynthesis protein
MPIPLYQVDAFTDKPFAGNPAAVCMLPAPAEAAWMQKVAQEMNLSETAFLSRAADGYDLRWFTTATEVRLCGHATLASAHTLWEAGYLNAGEQARFHTQSGLLTAEKKDDWIEMNFPAREESAVVAPAGLAEALGLSPSYVTAAGHSYLVLVESEEQVRAARPDFAQLARVAGRGVILTAPASSAGFDFVSRFFAPHLGINEDPVTGSAHCSLAPFWRKRLHKDEFVAYQASARGGVLHVQAAGDRVHIGGQAVTVFRAELLT